MAGRICSTSKYGTVSRGIAQPLHEVVVLERVVGFHQHQVAAGRCEGLGIEVAQAQGSLVAGQQGMQVRLTQLTPLLTGQTQPSGSARRWMKKA